MFFGREDDFNYAKIKLEGAAQGGVVLVFCGERRAGKSSILYQILNGRLGDRFGRRRMFSLGLALFTMASAACGAAPTPAVLIVAGCCRVSPPP